ncbi:MAG TPA: GNAT family N-acetyltransferase [Dehalococcoidia bacterium]|nr:GNAT family N-acetyltransferase [Dehalococcoidia bacterium]
MSETPQLRFRPMVEADLGATMLIRRSALDALARSEGRAAYAWRAAYPRVPRHILATDPGGCWVAEIDGVVVGFSMGFTRGEIWFLAQLFVLPDVHALGAGRELLHLAREYGRAGGARVFSVVSSTSPAAQSLYMRSGMFATGIGYRVSGPVDALLVLPEPPVHKKRIVDCAGWQDRIAELDRAVYGAERRQDHAFFLAGEAVAGDQTSFGLARDGEFLGYGYAAADDGWIGPLAAHDPADQLSLLRMAADWLTDRDVETGNAWALSLNSTVLGALLGAGWRINGWSFLKTSAPFGQFDRYHPSGGILL